MEGRGELQVVRGRGGGPGHARRRAVVSRGAVQIGEVRSDEGIGRVALGELPKLVPSRVDVAPGVRAHGGDQREAARELRIALERRELFERRQRADLPVVWGRGRRDPEGLEDSREPPSSRGRAHLPERPSGRLGVPARIAGANELDVERDGLGFCGAGREQALRGLLVPSCIAGETRERARHASRGGRGNSEHGGLAEGGLRPSGVSRANGPHVRRQEERPPSRLVRAQMVGKRLELRRERGRVVPVGQHVELERARRQTTWIMSDRP